MKEVSRLSISVIGFERAFWSIAQIPTRIGPSSIRLPVRSPGVDFDRGTSPGVHMSFELDFGIGRLGSSCMLALLESPACLPVMLPRCRTAQ